MNGWAIFAMAIVGGLFAVFMRLLLHPEDR